MYYIYQQPHAKQRQAVALLFHNAIEEATQNAPHSPAVTLGHVVLRKLRSKSVVSNIIILRAARLLIPLCHIQQATLKDFVKGAAA